MQYEIYNTLTNHIVAQTINLDLGKIIAHALRKEYREQDFKVRPII